MTKLRPKKTPDYENKPLQQAIGKMLADRVIPKLTDKKRAKAKTADIPESGEIEATSDLAAWFLGPRGENVDLFHDLVSIALDDHVFWRRNFHPTDPSPITESMKREEDYLNAVDTIKTEFYALLAQLKKSGPFASMRYQGHMIWDQTLPGMAGYFAAMLYNQNNVALEASPITTVLEVEACEDLCQMLGYKEETPKPWGHLTCGGSTANIEALWAARNLKYYPLSFLEGLNNKYPTVADKFTVTRPSGGDPVLLKGLELWDMLNLSVDEVLSLFERAVNDYEEVDETDLNEAIDPWTLQNMGFIDFSAKFLTDSTVGDGVILVPASRHYSLPKGAALLGVGAKNLHSIELDTHGRMNTDQLKEEINKYITGNVDDGKRHPIIAVVAVFGSTEEGTVDDLEAILQLQNNDYRVQDVDFAVHADCAWGGYFASLIDADSAGVPRAVSDYVINQYKQLGNTDTITIDPHKTGYLPYPAGALCYRNMTMRTLIAFGAPYINNAPGATPPELSLGDYGIEGSKPGAAAAGVYLSHAAIPLTPHGYGKLMTLTAYNCKIFHWKLVEMSADDPDFTVEPTPHWSDSTLTKEEAVKSFLSKLSGKTPQSILNDATGTDLATLREEGADLNILTYAFNYKKEDGTVEQELDKVNAFNEMIYDRISLKADGGDIYNYKILVSSTSFFRNTYGDVFFDDYARRLLGIVAVPASSSGTGDKIVVMRSTIMDPWITEDVDGKPFVEYIVAELFDIVREVVAEIQADPSLVGG